MLDRFCQIEPNVLIACDGYLYGGETHERMALVGELLAGPPSVGDAAFAPQCLPFDHTL